MQGLSVQGGLAWLNARYQASMVIWQQCTSSDDARAER